MAKKQWMPLSMRKVSCFVIIVINPNILERLFGNFMGILTRPRANDASIVDQTPTLSSSTPDNRTLSKEELETLYWLMSQLEPHATASSSFEHLGNLASSLNATSTSNIAEFDDPWIIVLGAFNHMTGLSSLSSSYHL